MPLKKCTFVPFIKKKLALTKLATLRLQGFYHTQSARRAFQTLSAHGGFLGRPEITEQLIEARGNHDLQHENGATPLTIAADRGHAAVAAPSCSGL